MEKNTDLNKQFKNADSKSKELILGGALKFFNKPSREISRADLKEAKKILEEIELWELEYGDKDYSMLKNNSILVAYLAYKFGEIVGLDEEEKSNVYIAALVRDVGKLHMCGKEKSKAYEYSNSPLKLGDDGFEEILEVLKKYPKETKKYLEEKKVFNNKIVDISFNYHFVYSNLFKEEKLQNGGERTQQDVVLWFADSLSAVSFSSLDILQRNYSKDRHVSLFEGLELLREQTGDMAPEFWNKASGAALMGMVLTMVVSFSAPSKSLASDYDSEEVVSLLNDYRGKQGLAPLRSNEKLYQAALLKAKDMLEKDYWSHNSPSGVSPWKFITGEGYTYSVAGENLAKGFDDVYKMKEALLNSPSHKKNIVDPRFEDIGVAVIDGTIEGKNVTLVVQMFARESGQKEQEEKEKEEKTPVVEVENNLKDVSKDLISIPSPTVSQEEVVVTEEKKEGQISLTLGILPVRFVYFNTNGDVVKIWNNVKKGDESYVLKFFDIKDDSELELTQPYLSTYSKILQNLDLFSEGYIYEINDGPKEENLLLSFKDLLGKIGMYIRSKM